MRSKEIVRKAAEVAPVISTTMVEIKNPKNAGRRSKYQAPKKDVAQAIGESVSGLVRAERHVKAVEKHPELKDIPTQRDAIEVAKTLDALPEQERLDAVGQIKAQPTPQAKQEAARLLSKAGKRRPRGAQMMKLESACSRVCVPCHLLDPSPPIYQNN